MRFLNEVKDCMKSTRDCSPHYGFIQLGCLGYLIAIALILGGGQGAYTALKNREPLRMTFKDYHEQRPSAEWVSLSEAQLNLMNSAYVTARTSDEVKEVYIAVEAVGNREDKPAWVLLESDNQELIDLMNNTAAKMNAMKSPEEMTPELVQSLFPARQISGLVQFGMEADSKTRDKLAKLDLALEKEFIIIKEGDEPNLMASLMMLAGGLLIGFFMLRGGSKKEAPPPLPQAPNLPPL